MGVQYSQGLVVPIYFSVAESYAMAQHVEGLNKFLAGFVDTLQGQPMAASKIRFCVLGFTRDLVCHLEPTDLRHVDEVPVLQARGQASYSTLFDGLRSRIPHDIERFKADGPSVLRPWVWFFANGSSGDGGEWQQSLAGLVDPAFRARPNITAFGFGQAGAIEEIATSPGHAMHAADVAAIEGMLSSVLAGMFNEVVASGSPDDAGAPIDGPNSFEDLGSDES